MHSNAKWHLGGMSLPSKDLEEPALAAKRQDIAGAREVRADLKGGELAASLY